MTPFFPRARSGLAPKYGNRMKKILLPLLCALCLVVPLPQASGEEPTFTLMVYLCGTDLETDGNSGSLDLFEMISANLSPNGPINVIIETGGTMAWGVEAIDPDRNERWIVQEGKLENLSSGKRQDMGDSSTLRRFITYSVNNYPADRYGLILWDHGKGSTFGVCFDEYTDNSLTTGEIHDALSGASDSLAGLNLAFIAFDACLMANYELANYVKDFADYMIASEELTPADGFDYQAILKGLKENPAMSTEDLCELIVDSFIRTNLRIFPDDYITISALSLRHMDALTAEMEKISAGLCSALDYGDLRTISRHRLNMRSFGDYDMTDDSSDLVDLRYFMETLGGVTGQDLTAFRKAFDDVVLFNRYTEKNLDNINGIAILAPNRTRETFNRYIRDYDPLGRYPQYTEFITGYTQLLNGGNYVFSSGTPVHATQSDLYAPPWQSQAADDAITGSSSFPSTAQQTDAQKPDGQDEGFDETDDIQSYYLELSDADMENLAYVEGNLMINISDEAAMRFIDLGSLRNAEIDWENNRIYSAFDGKWPTLEGQLIYMTDMTVTENSRRSFIDITINGKPAYLLVVFDADRPEGEIIGYSWGYDEHGMPQRGVETLAPGDVIIPTLYLFCFEDDGTEGQSISFEGDPIEYSGESLTFAYEDLSGEDTDFVYCFCLNDIYGDYQYSDFVSFTI